jgi:lipopolysaccharide/colanic/teichoic acid biosynthesis glycosyltransferase
VADTTRAGGIRFFDPSRILDVLVAGSILVIGAPFIALLAVVIRFKLGAPVLFRQERAGRNEKHFKLVKFRTMLNPKPGEEGPEFDEVRLTSFGRLLRSTSLDELPTMVNVLRGQMSLVGPRPLPIRYLPRYSEEHARRHEVRPGITGWAQANGRNALTWDDQLDMDVWYVDHRSLRLDLKILAKTAATVLKRDGISQEGHATRPEFPGSGMSAGAAV